MSWLQLTLTIADAEAEGLAAVLEDAGAVAVTMAAASAEPVFANDQLESALWERLRLTALFDAEIAIEQVLASLVQYYEPNTLPPYQLTRLAEQDWSQTWKQGLQSMLFGERLWVHPSWLDVPEPQRLSIVLDPGMAFGTGTHPTTAMCLEWLARQELEDMDVVDYGCGSGILGMAALRLGARQVWAVDNDPVALTVALENAERNGITTHFVTCLPEQLTATPVDILVANILAEPLVTLAPQFAALVKNAGRLVLSGLLTAQEERCMEAYTPWFRFAPPTHTDEWVMLQAIRI
jgi:ribosomal protein L11 methyltransferase